MSRVAKVPVALTKGVEAKVGEGEIEVKGPLGTLSRPASPLVKVTVADGSVSFDAADETAAANAMSGTMRALVAGMVQGVSKGFERKLMLVGVGYRAQAQGDKLNLSLGFSHPIVHQLPASRCHVWPSPASESRCPVSGMNPRSLRKSRPTSL